MCPAALDHSAFPHILEAVVGFSDFETLRALRRVSVCVRARVDALLGTHVVVTPTGARTPAGERVPSFSPHGEPAAQAVARLDVRADPDAHLRRHIAHAALGTVRVSGACTTAPDLTCDTLVLASLHALPARARARTLVLDTPFAPGYTHLVAASLGECRTLVVPRGMRVRFLEHRNRCRVAVVSLEEWGASRGDATPE